MPEISRHLSIALSTMLCSKRQSALPHVGHVFNWRLIHSIVDSQLDHNQAYSEAISPEEWTSNFDAAVARSSDVHAVLAHCLARSCKHQSNFPKVV